MMPVGYCAELCTRVKGADSATLFFRANILRSKML